MWPLRDMLFSNLSVPMLTVPDHSLAVVQDNALLITCQLLSKTTTVEFPEPLTVHVAFDCS